TSLIYGHGSGRGSGAKSHQNGTKPRSSAKSASRHRASTLTTIFYADWQTSINGRGLRTMRHCAYSTRRLSSITGLLRPTAWPHGATSGGSSMDGWSTARKRLRKAHGSLGRPWSLEKMTQWPCPGEGTRSPGLFAILIIAQPTLIGHLY